MELFSLLLSLLRPGGVSTVPSPAGVTAHCVVTSARAITPVTIFQPPPLAYGCLGRGLLTTWSVMSVWLWLGNAAAPVIHLLTTRPPLFFRHFQLFTYYKLLLIYIKITLASISCCLVFSQYFMFITTHYWYVSNILYEWHHRMWASQLSERGSREVGLTCTESRAEVGPQWPTAASTCVPG